MDKVDPSITESARRALADRGINGDESRYYYASKQFPWAAVGRIIWSNGVICTGALVGPRHVLTVQHCLETGHSGTFSPGFDEEEKITTAYFTNAFVVDRGDTIPCHVRNDWTVLILDREIAHLTGGYFGIKMNDPTVNGTGGFTTLGYPIDLGTTFKPQRQDNVNITKGGWYNEYWECEGTGPVYVDADVEGRQSGSPVWETVDGMPYIWGVLSTSYVSGNGSWTGCGSGQAMLEGVAAMRNDFP